MVRVQCQSCFKASWPPSCLLPDTQVSKTGVFLAASGALVFSTLIAVLVGSQLAEYISPRALKLLAGVGFIVIGTWVLWTARV